MQNYFFCSEDSFLTYSPIEIPNIIPRISVNIDKSKVVALLATPYSIKLTIIK